MSDKPSMENLTGPGAGDIQWENPGDGQGVYSYPEEEEDRACSCSCGCISALKPPSFEGDRCPMCSEACPP